MKRIFLALLVVVLTGCATAVKIDSGEHTVGNRLVFNLDGAWNQVKLPNAGIAETWTMEGLPIDQLLVYSGVKDSEEIVGTPMNASTEAQKRKLAFRSSMRPDEIVSLFEGMFIRDGSAFTLVKLDPANFGGRKGFRFECSVTRKVDGARLSGIGYGVVDAGELFAIVYVAPRLTFFPRHEKRVELMAGSATVKAK
jgi:hypothetical protein